MLIKILCKSALAAVTLSTILEAEGHACVWLNTEHGPAVATLASPAAVMACVATCETALRVPFAQRTQMVQERC